MALDERLKRELVAARNNITTQLLHLESASLDPYSFGGSPDTRDVYAELRKELREIDDLLGISEVSQDLEPAHPSGLAYWPMATVITAQGQWMWRFRGIAAGAVALWAVGWGTLFILRTARTSLLPAGLCLLAICLASAWVACSKRDREFRLFLFTVAMGTALVAIAMLLTALSTS